MKQILSYKYFNVLKVDDKLEYIIEHKLLNDCALRIGIVCWDADTKTIVYEDIDFRTIELMSFSKKAVIREYAKVCENVYSLIGEVVNKQGNNEEK